MLIREATDADWPQIFDFFQVIVAEGKTYAYPDGLSSEQAYALWMEQPPARTVVAVEGEVVLGSAKFGPNRPARGSHIGTASFMVAPSATGRGVGRALAEYVIDELREADYHAIQFNAVVETNTAAVHLWQDLGFTILTTVPEAFDHPEHGLVGLHIMYLPLKP